MGRPGSGLQVGSGHDGGYVILRNGGGRGKAGGLAEERGVSLGHLVREACRERYRLFSTEERLEAVRELGRLELPAPDPATMKEESVPRVEDGRT